MNYIISLTKKLNSLNKKNRQILSTTKSEDYLKDPSQQKNQVAKYEKQIDQLVYQLYNLTPEEIKIIEESI